MKSLERNYLNKLSFTGSQVASLRSIGEFQGKQALYFEQSPQVLNTLKQVAVIESSESSNRLEGITVPHDRIAALIQKQTKPRDRSEQEVAGYRDALALIHESASYMEFNTNVILQIHSVIYRYLASEGGKWKATDNEIIEWQPDGTKRVRFKPTCAVQTPVQIKTLCENYKTATDEKRHEPLIVIPLAILDFLCIHPFQDGNGRVARLLTLKLLYHFNYEVGRFISLERIFEESKESYYETLEQSSQRWHQGKHDVMPWLNYFWGVLLRAYKEFEDRVGSITTGKGSKTEQIRQEIGRRSKPFAISDIEASLPGISRDMIRIVLRQLRDERVITRQGKGRGTKWLRKKDVS